MWTRLHSNTVSNRPTNHVTKAHPTASAEQPFHHIPSETRGLWLSGAEVIDLTLLNVSLTFPAVGLMKQCQIRADIKNRRTSGGGDAFYQSVVFVSLESVSVCVRIDVYGCASTPALHAIDANDTGFGLCTHRNPARTAGKRNTPLFKHPPQHYTPASKHSPQHSADHLLRIGLNWSGL